MATFRKGNIFESGCKALVNPVNCVGVMGGGLAALFRNRFPRMFHAYRIICEAGKLRPGSVMSFEENGTLIINFPTKDHWKDVSKLEYIQEGLDALVDYINGHMIESVAIPALGCGLGGLEWSEVKPLIIESAGRMEAEVVIYEPH